MIALCISKIIIIIKKTIFFSLLYIRMSGKNMNFNDKKKQKKQQQLFKGKKINNIDDIDVNNILVS